MCDVMSSTFSSRRSVVKPDLSTGTTIGPGSASDLVALEPENSALHGGDIFDHSSGPVVETEGRTRFGASLPYHRITAMKIDLVIPSV